MPLDILFEVRALNHNKYMMIFRRELYSFRVQIFGHLKPADLLHLARSNRELRGLLMSKNSISVWKKVRRHLLTPSCPPDFSEPRWADLLFGGTNCQVNTDQFLS
jgi:hypothetical protein